MLCRPTPNDEAYDSVWEQSVEQQCGGGLPQRIWLLLLLPVLERLRRGESSLAISISFSTVSSPGSDPPAAAKYLSSGVLSPGKRVRLSILPLLQLGEPRRFLYSRPHQLIQLAFSCKLLAGCLAVWWGEGGVGDKMQDVGREGLPPSQGNAVGRDNGQVRPPGGGSASGLGLLCILPGGIQWVAIVLVEDFPHLVDEKLGAACTR